MERQILELAEAGQLDRAIARLEELLNDPELGLADRGHSLLLYGRCQCARLASAQAIIAYKEATESFKVAGEPELATYAQAMQLRHLLDQRRIKDIEDELIRLHRLCSERNWILARSVVDLYTGLVADEQRRFTDAVEHFKRYLATPDPYRLPWEERMARVFMLAAIKRGGMNPAEYAGYLPTPRNRELHEVPRVALQEWISRIIELYVTNQFEACRQQLHEILDYLVTDGGEWAGRLRWLVTLETNLGNVYEDLGDHTTALHHYNAVIDKAREWGFSYQEHLALSNRASLLLWTRQPERALIDLTKCARYFNEQNPFPMQICRCNLAVAQLAMGDTTAARATMDTISPLPDSTETDQWRQHLVELLQSLILAPGAKSSPASEEVAGIARNWITALTRGS